MESIFPAAQLSQLVSVAKLQKLFVDDSLRLRSTIIPAGP